MRVSDFVTLAQKDETVYISDVEKAFDSLDDKTYIYLVMDLIEEGAQRDFGFYLPATFKDERLISDFFYGKIYNIISTLGGRTLSIYYDTSNEKVAVLVKNLNLVFDIAEPRKRRKGYARGINVADRMNEVICGGRFSFNINDIKNKPSEVKRHVCEKPVLKYIKTVDSLSGLMCGIDIGGTDIKLAVSRDNQIVCFKEFDWFPASYPTIEEIVNPVLLLIRMLRVEATFRFLGGNELLRILLDLALDKHAKFSDIEKCVSFGESLYKDRLLLFDGIGMCFPDVVIKNKIVGGEVSKVRAVRENPRLEFEEEFMKLNSLDVLLQKHCKPKGVVKITNDGPMAAYTAAVEIAYGKGESVVEQGVFVHTLGTELGTGWVNEEGEIPEIPMEAYNYVIDLGSYDQRKFEPDDLRSVKNFSTSLPGTVQKYTSQSGVFRLAIKYFLAERMDLYAEMVDKGFIVERDGGLYVPTKPKDLRKPFLEFVMSLPERENCPVCERIFREIGEFLAVTTIETKRILEPKAKERVLFGRLVKNKRCFRLMQEGASRILPDIKLSVADGDMANTPLMKQLKVHPDYTVAQFAQAVGSIYFAMSGRLG